MLTKNNSMTIDTASLLAVSSELFSKYNIITLPESANYECQDILNVLLHAATAHTNSLESTRKDLQRKNPDLRIPSADTVFNYITDNKIEDILSAFRKMNFEIFKMKLENNMKADIITPSISSKPATMALRNVQQAVNHFYLLNRVPEKKRKN